MKASVVLSILVLSALLLGACGPTVDEAKTQLAFIYFTKRILPTDEDAQAVYGAEPDDAHLPAQRLSAGRGSET